MRLNLGWLIVAPLSSGWSIPDAPVPGRPSSDLDDQEPRACAITSSAKFSSFFSLPSPTS